MTRSRVKNDFAVGIDDDATSTALTVTDSGIAATLTTAAQPNITSVGTLAGFTSTGIDDNATSNAMTINSSNDFTFGGNIETTLMHTQTWQTGSTTLTLTPTAGATDQFVFNTSQNAFIDFKMNGVAKASITTNGITFNGDTATANALDDYEEGTWTPILGGDNGQSGQVYGTQAGWYRKVGSLVVASFFCTLTTRGTISGNAIIGGLPVSSQGNANYRGHISSVAVDSIGVNANSIVMTVLNSTTQGRLGWNTTESASHSFAGLGSTIFVNGCTIQGTITYSSV